MKVNRINKIKGTSLSDGQATRSARANVVLGDFLALDSRIGAKARQWAPRVLRLGCYPGRSGDSNVMMRLDRRAEAR